MAQAMQVGQLSREAFTSWMRDVWLPEEKQNQPVFPNDYTMVAIVEGDDENKAYELTNHIENPWWENTGVTLIGEPEHRSTSVGDVVIMPDGRVLRVENAGWKVISTRTIEAFCEEMEEQSNE